MTVRAFLVSTLIVLSLKYPLSEVTLVKAYVVAPEAFPEGYCKSAYHEEAKRHYQDSGH